MANVAKTSAEIVGKTKGAAKMLSGYPGIFHHLAAEHAEAATLMARVKDASPDVREELFPEIRKSLLAHASAEEEEFYPKLDSYTDLKGLVAICREQHEVIKGYIDELHTMERASDVWYAEFEDLMHAVEVHVRLEEDELFPKAKELMHKEQAEEMLKRYEHVEQRLKAQY